MKTYAINKTKAIQIAAVTMAIFCATLDRMGSNLYFLHKKVTPFESEIISRISGKERTWVENFLCSNM